MRYLVGDATPFYRFAQIVFRLSFGLARGMRIEGLEHIPAQGPCLVVSNHISWLDPPVLGCSVPHRQMHFMAKRELFDRRILGRLIAWLGSFPVDRGQADRKSLRMALDLLEAGRIVCIFPEGTRGRAHEEMQAWHIGMAMIAHHAQVPIVPAAVKHTRDLLEDRAPGAPRRKIWVRFGPPLDHSSLEGRGKARLAQIQEQSFGAVTELLQSMGE